MADAGTKEEAAAADACRSAPEWHCGWAREGGKGKLEGELSWE